MLLNPLGSLRVLGGFDSALLLVSLMTSCCIDILDASRLDDMS